MLKIGVSVYTAKQNGVDHHEMGRYELSHLGLHCLHKHVRSSTGLKRLIGNKKCSFYKGVYNYIKL